MKKLKLKQKEWFTLADAAKYLTDSIQGQTITESDVIHFIAIGELVPSIYFSEIQKVAPDKLEYVNDHGRVSIEEMPSLQLDREFDLPRPGTPLPPQLGFLKAAPGSGSLTIGGEYTVAIAGLWDVNLSLLDDSPVTRKMLARALKGQTISSETISEIIKDLGEPEKIRHSIALVKFDIFGDESQSGSARWEAEISLKSLSEGATICVRLHALQELFENESTTQTVGLSRKEKKTFLRIIRALCEDNKHLDLSQHSTTAGQIIAMADSMGLTIPSKRTLETLLKEARELED